MSTIEQYKNSISERYVEDFKKELNFFERIMLLPVSKKMEEVLKSNKKINVDNLWDLEDLWFWRKVLWVRFWNKWLFEKLSNKTFSFLKEKQEKIIQAESSGKLAELQNLVINWKLDELEIDVDSISRNEDNNQNNSSSENVDSDTNNNSDENKTEEWENTVKDDKEWKWDYWQASVNPIVAWVGTWALWWAAYYGSISRLERTAWIKQVKEVPNWFDVGRTKNLMDNISADLLEKAKSPKINTSMKAAYEKSAKIFNESASSLTDDVGKAFVERQKLGDKLPESVLKSLWINKKFTKIIDAMPDEELMQIIGKNSDEVKQFFKTSKWIDITDDLAKQLTKAQHVSDLRWMNSVFKHARPLTKVSKWIKWLWAIAVISFWVDVWVYFNDMDEANTVKKINEIRWEILKDKAHAQLWIGAASLVAEAAIIMWYFLSAWALWWPVWLAIWLIVWAITFATSVLVDELYYDKKEFYSQNRYDYINQERTVIKQSIVQLLESDRLWMHEKMKASVQAESVKKWKKLDTMEEAREALIYQEETLNNNYEELGKCYNSGKSEEDYEKELKSVDSDKYNLYLKEKEKMENIIKIRMEYIKDYIKKDKNTTEYKSMIEMISQSKWIEYVENVLANSKVYEHIKLEHEDEYVENYKDMTVEQYKESFKEKLKSEYPDKFDVFEKLSVENPVHFYEICIWTLMSKSSIMAWFENGIYVSPQKEIMEENLKFIERYFEYRKLGRSIEKQIWVWIRGEANAVDYYYIEQVLKDFWALSIRPTRDREKALTYFSYSDVFQSRLEVKYQASDNTGQNILYSIAREFHWYSWNNDYMDIINFYNEGISNHTWMYYEDSWRVNQDLDWTQKFQYMTTLVWFVAMFRAWMDTEFDLRDIDKKNMTADQVCDEIIEWKNWSDTFQAIYWKAEWLDSSIEAADEKIIKEFKRKTREIIEREIGYRDQKEVYEKKLIDFIKTQCSGKEGCIEIPYDLVVECKKAKIWDVEKYLFKIENWEIVALSTWVFVGDGLNLDKTKQLIKYESISPMRKELTQEEKDIISKVKMAHDRLEDIRILESSWAELFNTHKDDLWIPIEQEREMSHKRHEREKIEKSLFYLSPISAKQYLSSNWEKYYSYFEDTYIWMMATISQFDMSDNLWNINRMNQAWAWIWVPIVEVKDNQVIIPETIKLEKDEKFYLLYYIQKIKDEKTGKTAEQLLLANEHDDESWMTKEEQNEKWRWMARQILIAVLEQETILFNDNGRAKAIGCNIDLVSESDVVLEKIWKWEQLFDDYYIKQSQLMMENRIKRHLWYSSNIEVKSSLYNLDTNSISTQTQEIKEVSEWEQAAHESINQLTQKILQTKEDVDWAWKRWTPNFIADYENTKDWIVTWIFESWWNSVKVSFTEKDSRYVKWLKFECFKIDGLDVSFNLEDWLRMANLINWVKYQIPRNPDYRWNFYYWTVLGYLKVNDSFANDTAILREKTAEEFYPDMCNSNKDKILSYLNSL